MKKEVINFAKAIYIILTIVVVGLAYMSRAVPIDDATIATWFGIFCMVLIPKNFIMGRIIVYALCLFYALVDLILFTRAFGASINWPLFITAVYVLVGIGLAVE